jgi:serine/threonine-protein kinase HipA
VTARCLSTLVDLEEEGFSPAAQRVLADGGRRVPHQLTFSRRDVVAFHKEHVDGFSISGVQVKISLRLHRGELLPTEQSGEFILKPRPTADFEMMDEAPANEHLTMQLATQLFGIRVAANALVRFSDGELAYMTRRFDRTKNGRVPQEDFAQVLGRSSDSHGPSYKYDASYEMAGNLIHKHVAADRVEIEKLFQRIVFNYVFSNGDAHLKNFSLYRTAQGDYVLTPAYDLMCTRLHLPHEARMALDLFEDDYETPSFQAHGFNTSACFHELGKRFGMVESRMTRILRTFPAKTPEIGALVERSFLSPPAKERFMDYLHDRLRALAFGLRPGFDT